MSLFDRYLFKNLLLATVFISVTLAMVIFLTQSLRFLELVINSGASSSAFWILTFLALPRFFEIIVPIALMGSIVFIYNKMTMDSEIIVMRSLGSSPLNLARPALILSLLVTLFLMVMTGWAGPASLAKMQEMRTVIKSQYSNFLFREGIFNSVVPGLTVFVKERGPTGELHGMMIHDSRDPKNRPVTVVAKRGLIVSAEDGQQVVVFDGSRQSYNRNSDTLERLDFERYSIDLPEETGPVHQRWQEPDERTFFKLFRPDPSDSRDMENRHEFIIEIHRRVVSPLLAPAFAIAALSLMLLGPLERRGQSWRVIGSVVTIVLLQGLYMASFNLSRSTDWGLALMYLSVLIPALAGLFLLSNASEKLRQTFFFEKFKKEEIPI